MEVDLLPTECHSRHHDHWQTKFDSKVYPFPRSHPLPKYEGYDLYPKFLHIGIVYCVDQSAYMLTGEDQGRAANLR